MRLNPTSRCACAILTKPTDKLIPRQMARDLFSRYVWIVDTITRYGSISRERLNQLWLRSHLSDGNPIPERTFFHYRRAIEENFHIDIE